MKKGDKFVRLIQGDYAQTITYAGKKKVNYLFKAIYQGHMTRFYRTLKEIKNLGYNLKK